MGRGATAAALAWRAFLRETFLPGCMWSTLSDRVQAFSQHGPTMKRVVCVRPLVHLCESGCVDGNRTWSKWVRTRRCQSLRKSGRTMSALMTPSGRYLDCVYKRRAIEGWKQKGRAETNGS